VQFEPSGDLRALREGNLPDLRRNGRAICDLKSIGVAVGEKPPRLGPPARGKHGS
jgi:hypothetical protein